MDLTKKKWGYNQPKGLGLLFFTELWERFGYYTQQTIIILFMTKSLLFSDYKANYLYAAYSSLFYITPVIGGYLADRYLGFQRAIIIGGVLLLCGYLLTSLTATPAVFFLGLSVLICGNGFFKPNVSSIVGDLYEKEDPRRDGGFTLFYMGINLGALIPPLFAGALVTYVGWHAGFLAAALGMAISLTVFLAGKKILQHRGKIPAKSPLLKSAKQRNLFYSILWIGIALAIFLCNLAFKFPQATNTLVIAFGVLFILVVLGFLLKEPLQDRKKMLASIILIVISIGFWALYMQTFTSLTLFADRNMVHHLWFIPLDAQAMLFFNAAFIILLSPLLGPLWVALSHRGLNPSIPLKFALGILMISLGFLLLGFATKHFTTQGALSPVWLIVSYFLQTLGELLISPIGLSMITLLSPKHLVGMMMGVWFFALAAAFAVAGLLANIAAVPAGSSVLESLGIYHHAFNIFGYLALVTAIISFILVPFLDKLIQHQALTTGE